jgi:hypothetical protein
MSGFGSSPWLAMRFSPSLRAAYDEIGGQRLSNGARDAAYDGDSEPVDLPGMMHGRGAQGNGRTPQGQRNGTLPDDDINGTSASLSTSLWREEPATPRQLAYLRQLGIDTPEDLTRGQASDLINQARQQQQDTETTDGQAQPASQELVNRFVSLEQALTTLTEALTNPTGTGRIGNGQADESPNGPIPDWLRDDDGIADADEMQNVNIVSAATDPSASSTSLSRSGQVLDRDGHFDFAQRRLEDKYETAQAAPTQPTSTGTVRLEPYQDSRRQVIHDTLARLEDPHSLAGQAAYKTLVVYTGERNAGLIQAAVNQHTATAVQEATAATADLVAQYRDQEMGDDAVLAAFQSGEAAAAIREASATPLSDEQLSAVADMVLLPQRRLTRTELVTVIGREAAAGAAHEQAIAQAIGLPIGFGGQTGNVRGVMAGARTMNLSPAELARLAEMIQDGLRDVVQAELVGRGYRPDLVRDFVSDTAALPSTVVVPQSTSVVPTVSGTTADSSPESPQE